MWVVNLKTVTVLSTCTWTYTYVILLQIYMLWIFSFIQFQTVLHEWFYSPSGQNGKIISILYIMYNCTAFQTGTQNIVAFMFPHTHSTCNMFWSVILARIAYWRSSQVSSEMSLHSRINHWYPIIVRTVSRDCLLTFNWYHKGVPFGKLAGKALQLEWQDTFIKCMLC